MTQEIDDTRKNYPHYHKNVEHLKYVDVYRVLDLFGVTNPAIQHAIKKLLVPGRRGTKDIEKDLREAVVSINRALQMIAEDDCVSTPLEGNAPAPINGRLTTVYFCDFCLAQVQDPCSREKCPVAELADP